jgi:hypothetical protein
MVELTAMMEIIRSQGYRGSGASLKIPLSGSKVRNDLGFSSLKTRKRDVTYRVGMMQVGDHND